MRGQAFVVCGDEDQAAFSIKQLQFTLFYGKPLRLSYAKKVSDVISKIRGTFDENLKV